MMGSSDSLNGLAFGKKIYFEYVGSGGGGGGSSSKKGVADPPPPAKKGKWAVVQQKQRQQQHQQQQQIPRCQVEGCRADLTDVKAYYCRHKVCGMHSKSPKVVVAGIEQRFCQQCSRFHQLNEFDQGKRSCRRRLAGHNERRRKPPPGILPPGYGRLSSSENSGFRGFLMDFTYPRPPVNPRAIWPTVTAGDRVAGSSQWQGSFSAPHGVTVAHPYMQPPAHFTAHELPSSESLAGVTDSSCALSLLSNQTWGSDASPRNRGPTISASSRLETGPTGQHMTTVPNNYIADNWGFRGHGTGNTSHQIQQDMEIRHFDNGHDRFSGELELALQGNNRQFPDHIPARSYDQSGRIMNWSL